MTKKIKPAWMIIDKDVCRICNETKDDCLWVFEDFCICGSCRDEIVFAEMYFDSEKRY